MARNFYYGTDARIVAGSARFVSQINAGPSAFGLSPERAASYAALDAVLQSAFHAAITPVTRTPVAVLEKDEALRAVRLEAARVASIISATATVDDAQLLALGLLPRPRRARRSAPDGPPIVEVVRVVGRRVTVRFRAQSSDGAGKPLGCLGAQLYVFPGNEPPTDARQYRLEGLATRKTHTIQFPNDVASGSTAWISAVWVSRSGKTSVASNPIRVTIQGGPVLAASA